LTDLMSEKALSKIFLTVEYNVQNIKWSYDHAKKSEWANVTSK